MLAETPTVPEEVTGTIWNISDDTVAQIGAKAVSFINWSMSENIMETAIDYFEIILMGTNANNTMSVRMADQYSQRTFSQKYVLSEGNYTSVSIAAVDLCGKRSESVQVRLTNTTTVSTCVSNLASSNTQQQNVAVITGPILGVLLLIFVVVAVALSVAVTILALHLKDKSPTPAAPAADSVKYNNGDDQVNIQNSGQ